MKGMPLILKVAGRDVPMKTVYDSLGDLVKSGDYPVSMFDMWAGNGKLYIQLKAPEARRSILKTPNRGKYY